MHNEVEISALDLRYQGYRMKNSALEGQLLASIAQRGIQEPLEGAPCGDQYVLLNGFKRYRCARRLQIGQVPYLSLASEEVMGILMLLRIANTKALGILEQAAFVDQLHRAGGMSIVEIATQLCRGKAWVCMRLGLIDEMTPVVREKLMDGSFPVYPYMYHLRPFMRMNGVKAEDIEQLVVALSGHPLSVRDIEQLAHGFFRGPQSLRQQILEGNLALPLRQLKEVPPDPQACSEFERLTLRELELIDQYMQRVMAKCHDERLASRNFHAQNHLLTNRILSRSTAFIQSLRKLHDRSGQA